MTLVLIGGDLLGLLLEEPLDPRLHLCCEKGEGLEEVLLGEPAYIHLEEMSVVPHVLMKVDDPLSHIVWIAHVVSAGSVSLGEIGAFVRLGPAPEPSHLHIEVVPARIEAVESLLLGRCDKAECC